MGIGPMRITAPPLALPKFDIDPTAIRRAPRKIAAKANKNNRLANPNCNG